MSALHGYLTALIDALDVPAITDDDQRLLDDRVRTVLACLRQQTVGRVRVADLPGDTAIMRDMLARTDDRVAELRAERDRLTAEWRAQVAAIPADRVTEAAAALAAAGVRPNRAAAWDVLSSELDISRWDAMRLTDRIETDREPAA